VATGLVAEAAVVGLPVAGGGEDVTAAVVLAPGAAFDEAGLREHCRETLAADKVPRRIVVVDELPKNLISKTLRRRVREQLLSSPT
jgi:long-chain acyl-CoA synthetase